VALAAAQSEHVGIRAPDAQTALRTVRREIVALHFGGGRRRDEQCNAALVGRRGRERDMVRRVVAE